jgi:hypothetical protein
MQKYGKFATMVQKSLQTEGAGNRQLLAGQAADTYPALRNSGIITLANYHIS